MQRTSLKELILGIVTITAVVGSFWLWHEVIPSLVEGAARGYTPFLLAGTGLLISAVFFSLTALFVKDARLAYAVAFVSVGIPYFFVSATGFVLAAFAVSIFLAWFAVRRVRLETAFSLGFSAAKTLKTGLPLYFTIASLIVTVFYFAALDTERAFESILPQPTFNALLKVMSVPLESLIGLSVRSPDATVDEVLSDFIRKQLQSQGAAVPAVLSNEVARLVESQRDAVAKQLGITLVGSETVSDVFYTAIADRLKILLGPYARYLPAISAIAFFFAFKAATVPLYFITLVAVWVVVKALVAAGVLRYTKEKLEVERLTL
ncbi:MAG: hypothetical protein A3C07_02115 [Candidatus Sungbacteria bacterium RIFCSPHIGHO2_02_FULL_47_11]|uniref:Uncharacterized protein n=1 Tax=Candidatus Sungbacteria bacterium RIFCSPHIGHO2_02_FULL_47_11 TaxID=1802270 RepID=A0A1G2KN10_9BACT|nr:MAG: hypothetical protein A3C07_02115 [Candidatus Sungbacteria bacterium RIFCSPHIGHO2_02_FULL_47_11]